MPELPEVEHLRRSLLPHMTGARVVRASLLRRDVLRSADYRSLAALTGRVVTGLERHGKQLMLVTDGPVLLVQLGMTGMLRVADSGSDPLPHLHARARMEGAGSAGRTFELRFHDARRFGSLALFRSREQAIACRWAALGPAALALSGAILGQRLVGRRTAVKAALLDQGVVAGIGNIYADEALFQAGIHPCRPAASLRAAELERLAVACRATLAGAVAAGGSTIRDYVDACGSTGEFTAQHAVYGRSGQPCRTCGSPLERTAVAGRTTVFCQHCQPL